MAGTRKLATVETVSDIRPIDGADAISCARIRGWDVVVKNGEFTTGDLCVYIEVDTLVDVTDDRFAFLAPRGVRTDAQGNTGHVLKTAKLRGQYSQGLALPVAAFPEIDQFAATTCIDVQPGDDVTDLLPVRRWDPPIPAQLAGAVNGPRPGWIPMTDEDRIENNAALLTARDLDWVATEKIDGTSTSVWTDQTADTEPVRGVCSRNYDLTRNPEQIQWKLALDHDLHTRMEHTWPHARVVIQGETYGEGIQGNPLRVTGQHLAVFTVRVNGSELPRAEWPDWVTQLAVPEYDLPFPATVDDAVSQVETLTSLTSPGRPAEGVVWRARDAAHTPDGRASFKVISRRYLLKHDR